MCCRDFNATEWQGRAPLTVARWKRLRDDHMVDDGARDEVARALALHATAAFSARHGVPRHVTLWLSRIRLITCRRLELLAGRQGLRRESRVRLTMRAARVRPRRAPTDRVVIRLVEVDPRDGIHGPGAAYRNIAVAVAESV